MITDLPYPPLEVPARPIPPSMILAVVLLGLVVVVPLWMLLYMLVHEKRRTRMVVTLGLEIWPGALWRWFADLFTGPPLTYRARHAGGFDPDRIDTVPVRRFVGLALDTRRPLWSSQRRVTEPAAPSWHDREPEWLGGTAPSWYRAA